MTVYSSQTKEQSPASSQATVQHGGNLSVCLDHFTIRGFARSIGLRDSNVGLAVSSKLHEIVQVGGHEGSLPWIVKC